MQWRGVGRVGQRGKQIHHGGPNVILFKHGHTGPIYVLGLPSGSVSPKPDPKRCLEAQGTVVYL